MKSRSPDGRFRNHNKPLVLSERTLRARWLEGEALRLNRLGLSFEAIAQQITEVGHGQRTSLTQLPENIGFPANYKVTAMGCHKALRRALQRTPALEAEEMRRLDTDRCEEMFLALSLGIRQGNPQSVRAAVQVLALKAAINGYKSSDLQLKVTAEASWSSVLNKDETVSLFRQAITVLIEGGVSVAEMAPIAGLEVPAIDVKVTKIAGEGN